MAVLAFCGCSCTELSRLGLRDWLTSLEYRTVFKEYVPVWEETFWALYEAKIRHPDIALGDALPEEVKAMRCWSDVSMWTVSD